MNIYLPLSPRQRLKRAEREAARADALEKANDELRADLSSWMNKAVSSDG